MKERSRELLDAARRRLAAARTVLDEDPSTALSAAYYSMLYTARAALSERGVNAKTHRGTWLEVRRAFVETGELDADYDAWLAPADDATHAIELAQQLLNATEKLLGAA